MAIRPMQRAETQRLAGPDLPRQLSSSFADQVCPDVARPLIRNGLTGGMAGQVQCALGDRFLGQAGAPVEILNCPAALIAGAEIHPGIDARRIRPQQRFHTAQLFEAYFPVEQVELAQAGKRIPDGNPVPRLAVPRSQAKLAQGALELALKPALNRRQRRLLVIHIVNQLRREVRAWGGLALRQFREDRKDPLGIPAVDRDESVRPYIGNPSLTQFGLSPAGDLLDTFHERRAQHLRNGPEFPDRQR